MLTLQIKRKKDKKGAKVKKAKRVQRDTKVTKGSKGPKADAPAPELHGGKDTPKAERVKGEIGRTEGPAGSA